jgi:23S rRNA (guanine745-N1)-methyltransferase
VRLCVVDGDPFPAGIRCVADVELSVWCHSGMRLSAGHGKTKIDGDSKEMLQARRRFLQADFFGAVRDAVTDLGSFDTEVGAGFVVDAGCGEGSYLGALQRRYPSSVCVGADVSKEAIKIAAKTQRACLFVVSDSARLPLRERTVDVVLDIFAPRAADEFARVLRPGGRLVVAIPEPDHLKELRALSSLGIAPHKEERVREQVGADFDDDSSVVVRCVVDLHGGDLVDLLTMTPHHHHIDDDDVLPPSLSVTVAVKVLRFRRR